MHIVSINKELNGKKGPIKRNKILSPRLASEAEGESGDTNGNEGSR